MKKMLFLFFLTFSSINLNCMDFDDEDLNMSGYDGDEETYENEKETRERLEENKEDLKCARLKILVAKKIGDQISQSCPSSPVKRDFSSFDLNELKKILHESLPGTPRKKFHRKRRFEEEEEEHQSEDEDYNDVEIILENENGNTRKKQRLYQEN